MESSEYELMHRIESRYWWFVGKRRLILSLLRQTRFSSGDPTSILDVGCGTGGNMTALQEFGSVTGCDISPEAVDFCRSRGFADVVHQIHPEKLPFQSGRFSLVTCFDVLEHVENDFAMLAEIFRVLREGGALLLTAPAHPWLWSVHDDSLHHRRRYSLRTLLGELQRAGFALERATYMNALLLPLIVPIRWLRHILVRGKSPTSDFNLNLPSGLNSFFLAIFGAERRILRYADIPFGLSLMILSRKPRA